MTKQSRRRLITTLVMVAALSVFLVAILSPKKSTPQQEISETPTNVESHEETTANTPVETTLDTTVSTTPNPPQPRIPLQLKKNLTQLH